MSVWIISSRCVQFWELYRTRWALKVFHSSVYVKPRWWRQSSSCDRNTHYVKRISKLNFSFDQRRPQLRGITLETFFLIFHDFFNLFLIFLDFLLIFFDYFRLKCTWFFRVIYPLASTTHFVSLYFTGGDQVMGSFRGLCQQASFL